jgi:hypothetical protein
MKNEAMKNNSCTTKFHSNYKELAVVFICHLSGVAYCVLFIVDPQFFRFLRPFFTAINETIDSFRHTQF